MSLSNTLVNKQSANNLQCNGNCSTKNKENINSSSTKIASKDIVSIDDKDVVELIKLCCENNKDAWEEFVNKFNRPIMLYTIREARNYRIKDADVLELVQEVFLKLLANDYRILKAFCGTTKTSFLCYLITIVRSVVIDIVRKEISNKRFAPTISLDACVADEIPLAKVLAAKEESSPSWALDKKFVGQKLKQILKAGFSGNNAVRDFKIFYLHTICGFSAREIGELPYFSISTVNVQAILLRAKNRLRKLVEA